MFLDIYAVILGCSNFKKNSGTLWQHSNFVRYLSKEKKTIQMRYNYKQVQGKEYVSSFRFVSIFLHRLSQFMIWKKIVRETILWRLFTILVYFAIYWAVWIVHNWTSWGKKVLLEKRTYYWSWRRIINIKFSLNIQVIFRDTSFPGFAGFQKFLYELVIS